MIDIVLSQLQAQPFVKNIYTTNHSQYIKSTLVEANFKIP